MNPRWDRSVDVDFGRKLLGSWAEAEWKLRGTRARLSRRTCTAVLGITGDWFWNLYGSKFIGKSMVFTWTSCGYLPMYCTHLYFIGRWLQRPTLTELLHPVRSWFIVTHLCNTVIMWVSFWYYHRVSLLTLSMPCTHLDYDYSWFAMIWITSDLWLYVNI